MVDMGTDYTQKIFGEYLGIQNEECLDLFRSHGRICTCEKDEVYFHAGEIQKEIPFLLEGSFWWFVESDQGVRRMECVTDSLYAPITPQASLEEFAQPLRSSMQALEPMTMYSVPTEIIIQAVMSYTEAAAGLAKLVSFSLQLHRRYQEWNCLPLKERYESFCEFLPGMSERLTKTVISQLLNTSLPALSRALKE